MKTTTDSIEDKGSASNTTAGTSKMRALRSNRGKVTAKIARVKPVETKTQGLARNYAYVPIFVKR